MFTLFAYNLKSLWVRRSATFLTALAMGATVAVLAGVLALQQGFQSIFKEGGRDGVAVFLRPGANSEGSSAFTRDRARRLIGVTGEIETDAAGPLAAMECFLAIRRERVDGGETNVPIRGVEQRSLDIYRDIEIVAGRTLEFGADEVIVGEKLVDRIAGCRLGEVIVINVTPFRVVGVFRSESPFDSEIWGDIERMLPTLNRSGPNRVVARMKDDTDLAALSARLENDQEVPAKVLSEAEYLANQTGALSATLFVLGGFLAVVMGIAAVFTAVNTMLAAISARTFEIGILLATGFRPFPIFLAFLFEAMVLGLLGGVLGCLIVLPINGIETGTTNFDTFSEVAFAFRVTPFVLLTAITFAILLGLIGGTIPAWKAARMSPTEALRRG
ncbi:MAG: ABC transporter permease [Planctomycetota bacterium]